MAPDPPPPLPSLRHRPETPDGARRLGRGERCEEMQEYQYQETDTKISTTSKNVTAFSYLAVLVDIAFLISGASPFTWYCGELFLLIL